MKNIADNTDFKIQDEILIFQNLIYILTRCRQVMINIYHNSKIHEHQDFNKIIERIFKTYYFSKIRKQVENTIRKCDVYVKVKHSRHRSYELLKSFSTLDCV